MSAKAMTVKLLDKEFQVACPEEEQDALHASAQFLDERMREIRGSGKVVGLERIAVMSALNLAHDLLKLKGGSDEVYESITERIHHLQTKVDAALNQGKQMEL